MNIDFGKWALSNTKIISLFVVILVAGGLYSYYSIPKLEDPEVVVRQALVAGIYPGASAHQVELELADPLEKAVRSTAGVDFVETRCYADMCMLKVSLNTTVPQEKITQVWDVMRHRIDEIKLPSGVEILVKDDFGDVFGMFYAITGEGFSNSHMSSYVDMIRRELQNIKGVSRIGVFGLPKECIRIHMRPDRMASLGVSPLEVVQTLNGQNATIYSGYYLSGGNRIRVCVDDRYRNVNDIASLIIKGHEDDQICLRHIAEITLEEETPVRESMERDGIRAIGLSISADSGTDIVKVGRAVDKKLKELKATRIPVGMEVDKVFNQPERVTDAMGSFMLNLLISVILVVMVLVFTMGMRSGMVIGISLVTIVCGSILILYYTGGTLQRVSLSSFILAMGMLVDNAIVIIDGVLVAKEQGKTREESLTEIGRRTAWPLLGATLIAILSFFPIFMSPDVTGIYVHDMFIVLAVSLLLSWFLALTHVPIMAGRWIYPHQDKHVVDQKDTLAYRVLRKTLAYVLKYRWYTVGVVGVLVAIAAMGFFFMPRGLFPDMEYDQLYMEYKLPEGSSEAQVKKDLDDIRLYLESRPEVTHVVTVTGGTPARYNLVRSVHAPSLSYGELIVDFTSPRALKRNINELQKEVSDMFPDAYVRFKRYNLMFMPYPIQLLIMGPDPQTLAALEDSCVAVFNHTGKFSSVITEWESSIPHMVVGYDQAKARYAGYSRQEVGTSLLASTDGIPVGSYYEGSSPLGMYVDFKKSGGSSIDNLNDAPVFGLTPDFGNVITESLAQGKLAVGSLSKNAPLRQVTKGIRIEWESPVVCRYNGKRTSVICAFPAPGVGTESARKAVAAKLKKMKLPDGYEFMWSGEKLAEDMSMENLFQSYPLVLLVILALLLLLFRSYKTVAVLVLSIPTVIVGVVPAVLISGSTFGFVAIVGVLGLVGMIIKNGIILVDEIKLQVGDESGSDFDESLIRSSVSRLRPVTMAAFTTVLGMIPLLFDSMFKSLAATIIGGLFVGTIIVLVLIPVLYSLMFKKQ